MIPRHPNTTPYPCFLTSESVYDSLYLCLLYSNTKFRPPFLPLLRQLGAMKKSKNRRLLIGDIGVETSRPSRSKIGEKISAISKAMKPLRRHVVVKVTHLDSLLGVFLHYLSLVDSRSAKRR